MENFNNKIAVVTGGGTGMGRELVRQLAKEGCHVAMCDVIEDNMIETHEIVSKESPNVFITKHICDVSNEEQVIRFRDEVLSEHNTEIINLLFNNAGIGGGGSFVDSSREEWERCFAVCWYGVYYCSRAFMPAMIASSEGHLVNTSSVNGFWASLGGTPHTSYSAAKFAVKGFSEALLDDFRMNAPHLGVSVVMPGHIGTSIAINTGKILNANSNGTSVERSDEEMQKVKDNMIKLGAPVHNQSLDQIRDIIKERANSFKEDAPTTAAEAATVILDGVKENKWRILIGEDAKALDKWVRESPEDAYNISYNLEKRKEEG
ncbi:SDR family oxidoreductase [Gammaproteobacteria bacterium]|nr:SDR family oxidoreductase [Gammaproteobacteria bacterium]|tara:strand:- start:168 stop:1124 length:957 start_codon:yes stop_codon:yes gene_type:complete